MGSYLLGDQRRSTSVQASQILFCSHIHKETNYMMVQTNNYTTTAPIRRYATI